MDGWALGVSIVALGVAVVGTALSNKRAKESRDVARQALQDVREAKESELWASAIASAVRVSGIAAVSLEAKDALLNLRVTGLALADGSREREGLYAWIEAENILGLAIHMAAVKYRAEENAGEIQRAWWDWAVRFTEDLRRMRPEHDPAALARLRDRAKREELALRKSDESASS